MQGFYKQRACDAALPKQQYRTLCWLTWSMYSDLGRRGCLTGLPAAAASASIFRRSCSRLEIEFKSMQ